MSSPSVGMRALQLVIVAMLAFVSGCRWGPGEQTSQSSTVSQQKSSNEEAQVIVQVINED